MRVDNTYKNNPNFFDVLIIGAGPAGLTAALYAQRANLKTGFLERETPGGKIVKTAFIENYPGFEKIAGYDLALKMLKQTNDTGAKYLYGNVTEVKKVQDIFHVFTEDGMTRYASAVIIASGMIEKKLHIPGEDAYYGRGISYCAICDGPLFKDKPVAVIGGGNSALEESLYLADITSQVYLIHRRDEFRADPSVVDHVKKNPKIKLILSHIPISFNGDNKKITSITVENLKDKTKSDLAIDCAFLFIGFNPVNSFVDKLNIIDKNTGFITVDKNMETKIKGLFCAGDVSSKSIRQISTAVGEATVAALSAKKYIENLSNE